MVTAKAKRRTKKLPFYHAFAYGNPLETPDKECPECRADISHGVSQNVKTGRGKREEHCRKCAGILNGDRDSNGKLLQVNKPSGELVVK
ncbi:hypothetical protein KKE60_04790 [Patescibacteria group bacterium]|nr:hypothetical protein [Patescibacteria group bacterium]